MLLPGGTTARGWFYDFLYLWHVPSFVVVTSDLSRSFAWSRRHLSRLVTTVAVPHVVFEAALAVLFLWRLATPRSARPALSPSPSRSRWWAGSPSGRSWP